MTVLHVDALVCATLGSGSKGNCTYIGDGHTGVLVDCGLSTRQILARMDAIGLGGAPIDAVLITHEHSDHVASAAILERKLIKRDGRAPPFLMTAGTHRRVREACRPENTRHVVPGATITLGTLTLEPHPVPHDTPDPVAWAVASGGRRVGVITDLGHAPKSLTHLLGGLDAAVVEFNHDEQMLIDGTYPWALKQRIRSNHGHLSNRQAARLLRTAAARGRLKQVVLGHLSEENNQPELAHRAAMTALHDADAKDVSVVVSEQRVPCAPLRVCVTPQASPPPPAQTSLFALPE